jgi:hypothetical protein
MEFANFSLALLRMIVFIFSTVVGRLIIGALLLIGGIVYGLGSHDIVYQWVQQQGSANIISGNALQGEDYYYHIPGSNTYYAIHAADFSPYPLPDTFENETASLQIEAGSAHSVSGTLNDGTTFSGTAYKVVHFVLMDTQGQHVFTTQEYRDHPASYYTDQWLIGGTVTILGFLLIAITLIFHLLFKDSENSRFSPGKTFVSLNSTPRSTWQTSFLLSWRAPHFRNPATPNDLAK